MADASATAKEIWFITTRESRIYTLDLTDDLASSETINAVSGTNGSYTLGVTAAAAVTVGTPAVNTGTVSYTDADGEAITIAVGKAIQVRLAAASGVVGTQYTITFLYATTTSDRKEAFATLQVI